MVSGTDEHGTPILVKADKEGVTARELADVYHASSPTTSSRPRPAPTTCTPAPPPSTTTPWRRSCSGRSGPTATSSSARPAGGDLPVDRAHAARPLYRGHLPDLRLRRARGDQCDNCGNQLDPIDLINPRLSKINGETPEFVETEHFFLDLPALAEPRAWLEDPRQGTGDRMSSSSPEPPQGHQAARHHP
jgi:methionyl-tRNA synthetase